MRYFNYHARNKKLIRDGLLVDYYYDLRDNKTVLILVFNNGKSFFVKEERIREYIDLISSLEVKK